jgi:drug/metabolite transporter (DMT)-like permease
VPRCGADRIWPLQVFERPKEREMATWLDWLLLVVMVAALTGGGFLVWWFIQNIRSR